MKLYKIKSGLYSAGPESCHWPHYSRFYTLSITFLVGVKIS